MGRFGNASSDICNILFSLISSAKSFLALINLSVNLAICSSHWGGLGSMLVVDFEELEL